MQVFLKVRVDVEPKQGQNPSKGAMIAAVAEAVNNAMWKASMQTFEHGLEDEVDLVYDYTVVMDTD